MTRDRMGNVVAVRKGERGRGRVLAAAHLDTVFPDAEISIRRARGKLLGPGIGDNSLSVAAVLAVGEALQAAPPRGIGDVLLAANVGEEGRGDLRGIRAHLQEPRRTSSTASSPSRDSPATGSSSALSAAIATS